MLEKCLVKTSYWTPSVQMCLYGSPGGGGGGGICLRSVGKNKLLDP